MAIYQLRTFADIVSAIREELKIPSTDTTSINRIKRDINIIYQNEVVPYEKWKWLYGHLDLTKESKYTTGTVSVTNNSFSATLSQAPATSKKGQWLSVVGNSDRYRIAQHTAGSTSVVLESVYTGSTSSAGSLIIWTDKVNLPADCREVIEVTQDFVAEPLEVTGLQKFRKYSNPLPQSEGRPSFYTVTDWIDPEPFTAISGLPALSTRASSGLVKTLTFASDVSSYLADGDRIEISGSGDGRYNGRYVVSSVSSASVTYTGVISFTESATSDSTLSIKLLNTEKTSEAFREMLVYPAVFNSLITLHIDYIKHVSPLEDDSDEPLMPLEDRMVLVYGALSRGWSRERNPEEAQRNLLLYERKLSKMAGKMDDATDLPIIRPSRVYLATKRSVRDQRQSDYGSKSFFGGGGSSPQTVSGLANRIAKFGSDGILTHSDIDTDEAEYIDNAIGPTSSTLNDNQSSAAAIFTYDPSTYSAVFMDYEITRGTGNFEVGTARIATDGTNVQIEGSANLFGTVGVTLSVAISGGSVEVRYTSTSSGTAPVFTYTLRRY